MMFLTVILNILVITTAIRVPTAWPEQEKRVPDLKEQQDTYNFDVDNLKTISNHQRKSNVNKPSSSEFYTPKLEQQTADAAYVPDFVHNHRRPSGSSAVYVTNNKKSQYHEKFNGREPDVRYFVPQFQHERPSTVSHSNVIAKNNNNNNAYYNQNIDQTGANVEQHNNHKSSSFPQPVIYVNHNVNFPTSTDGWMPITGQHNPHKVQELNRVYAHHNLEDKHNQISNRFANRRHSPPLNPGPQYKNVNDRRDIQSATHYQPSLQQYRVLNKNYRDDKTHEPSDNDEISEIQDESDNSENTNDDIKEDIRTLPATEHEAPSDVPTKPIYPGEGRWAIPGQKHQPFVSNHRFTHLIDDNDEKPEGLETFEKAAPSFERQHNRFSENLQSIPQKHGLGEYIDDKNEENKDENHEEQQNAEEEVEEDDEEDSFVPTRTLAQVRKTENEEHLPSDLDDPRLREVIKDSKIHTVYTEEGYEDIAYDHAGHEKNAEDSEGHEEFDKDAVAVKPINPNRRKPKFEEVNVAKEFENYEDPTKGKREKTDREGASDADVSASDYGNSNPNNNMKMKEFVTTKKNKTTEIKNMDDGDTEMEITSEIKILTQPNNVRTAHKFVRIVPKNKNKFNINDKKITVTSSDSSKILKRRKRFVNDFPKVQVEKDFLDVFNNEKQHILPVVSTEKYPYYNIRNTNILSKSSPLRYAEDMKNIPKKIPGRMTFYEQSRISECPEIPRNVNPIPDRVQQAQNKAKQDEESTENEGVVDLPDLPRLKNLGDKIDCLKLKLFGENPLDSPIFQESIIEPPESIFKELDSLSNSAKIQPETISASAEKALNEVAAISQSLVSQAANKQNEDENEEEQEDQSLETYSASDGYEDNDADYQTKVHKTIANAPESTLSSTTSNNSLSNAEELFVETSSENETVTENPAVDIEPLIVSTTTVVRNPLPTQYDDKVNLIPKHIYDQIDFAEDLEITSSATPVNDPHTSNATAAPFQDQIVETTEKFILSTISNNVPSTFVPKHIYDQIDFLDISNATAFQNNLNVTRNDGEAQKLTQTNSALNTGEGISYRQPKAFDIVRAPNLSKENPTRRIDNNESLPESAALRIRRRRRKRPQMPFMQIFDVNKFLPTPLPPLAIYPTTNSILPKYKTLSEVYYKDEIKPNEQLNVFADVINNIKNSPPEILRAEGSENVETVEEDTWNDSRYQKDHVKKLKVPPRKVRIKHSDASKNYYNSDNILYITSTTTSTTTVPPRRRRKNKFKNHKSSAQVYEEYLDAVKQNGKEHRTSSSQGENNKTPQKEKLLATSGPKDSYVSEDTSFYNPLINQDLTSGTQADDVLGLNPPFSVEFPPIYPSINNQNPLTESTTLNTFLVPGMKPPSNRKPLLYSDFRSVQHNRIRRRNNYHRISKRSPYKPSYSEIRRNKPSEPSSDDVEEKEKEEERAKEQEEEEDDYVPKRNRNFHYDVENDRVVYVNKKEEEKEEPLPEPQVEEEEEEEEGVEYLTLRPPKPKFVVITTERNGPSFLEYVLQLKNNSNYRLILDPQPTKKPTEEVTTKSDLKEVESTTTKQVETAVPEFLSIISKLRSSDNYKEIKDKKVKSTTTAAPEEEEVLEEIEEPNENVQNSPGGSQSSKGYDRSQIFDISGYLPEPKNYSPKTVIDYSKYKTIERAPVSTRHSLSSRYNSEDDDLPLNSRDTTQVPVRVTSEDNDKASSSEQETGKVSNRGSEIRRSGYSSSEERVEEEVTTRTTTELPEVTTARPRIVRTRARKRPTTTTSKPTSTTTSAVTARKRTRHRSRPTTTAEPTLEENYSHTERVVHKRLPIERYTRQNRKIPHNHKAFYTPLDFEEEADARRPVIQIKRKAARSEAPSPIPLPTNSTDRNSEELENPEETQSTKLPEVQVFKKYDPDKKHGGNYRREDQTPQELEVNAVPPTAYEIENSKEINRLSDVVPKPFAFYSDPTLPKSVNQLKEPKTVDLPSDSTESEPQHNSKEKTNKDYNDEYEDEVKISFDNNSDTALKTPVYIVKDPSKRLYYYAPVK